MQLQFTNIINGQSRQGATSHQCVDPRTEEPLWDAPLATLSDLDEAVEAAQVAFATWRNTTVEERAAILSQMADMMEAESEVLEEAIMKETGKSKLMAGIEIRNSCFQTRYYAQTHLKDEVTHEDETTKIVTTHSPLGTVGAICPWNFPLILANLKIISSLITGNCCIVKPSPFTPYSVLKFVELAQPLLPSPGILQCLNGGADLGAAMSLHPGIAKITFTGTIATGKKVMTSCATTLKRLTLELAGNDAAIVCEDVDLERVVPLVAAGSFFNAGQVCVATKRVYVHESRYEEFLRLFVEEVRKSYDVDVAKAARDAPTVFGPLSNRVQFDVVVRILEDCRAKGYDIVAGGEVAEKGFWVTPTIVARPPEDSLLVREEQFGPIIPILTYTSLDDAISRANLANAGLAASVYSSSPEIAESVARRLEAGSVYVNTNEKPNPVCFFSGHKDSGYGGEMGQQGLLSYCYTKAIHFAK